MKPSPSKLIQQMLLGPPHPRYIIKQSKDNPRRHSRLTQPIQPRMIPNILQPRPLMSPLNLLRITNRPLQRRPRPLHISKHRLTSNHNRPHRIKRNLPGRNMVRQPLQHGLALFLREIHRQALEDNKCWPVGRHVLQPGIVRRRGRHQLVIVALRSWE